MKRFIMFDLLLIFSLAVFVMSGCSSRSIDSNNSGDDGALEDVADFASGGNLTYDLGLVDISYALVDQHFEGGVAKANAVSYDEINFLEIAAHDSSNYWHIFSCSAVVVDDYNDTSYFSGVDSIRFATASGYTYYPGPTVISIDMHWHFATLYDGLNEYGDIASHAGVNIATDGYSANQVTFNGALSDSINLFFEDSTGACGMGIYFDQMMTDLVIDSVAVANGYCPPSGEIDLDFALNFNCEGDSEELSLFNMEGEFTASMEFNGTSVSVIVNDGTDQYSEVQSCVAGSPLRNALNEL